MGPRQIKSGGVGGEVGEVCVCVALGVGRGENLLEELGYIFQCNKEATKGCTQVGDAIRF